MANKDESVVMSFRMTARERDIIEKLAGLLGRPVSLFLRYAARDYAIHEATRLVREQSTPENIALAEKAIKYHEQLRAITESEISEMQREIARLQNDLNTLRGKQ